MCAACPGCHFPLRFQPSGSARETSATRCPQLKRITIAKQLLMPSRRSSHPLRGAERSPVEATEPTEGFSWSLQSLLKPGSLGLKSRRSAGCLATGLTQILAGPRRGRRCRHLCRLIYRSEGEQATCGLKTVTESVASTLLRHAQGVLVWHGPGDLKQLP